MRRYPIYAMILFLSAWTMPGCSLKADRELAAPAAAAAPVVSEPTDEPSDSSYYHYMEAQLQRKKGHRDKAIAYLERAIALDGESVLLKRELAALYADQKDYLKAVAILDDVLAREPLDVDALAMVGRLSQQLNRPQKAKAAYEKALANDPKRESIYPSLGRMYLAEGSLADAHRVFSDLVRHFPGSFVGHFYLGRVYAKQGRAAAAKAAFEKTLVLEPALLEPRFELIDLLRSEVPEGQWVTVGSGETLGGISRRVYERYDADVERALLAANPKLADAHDIRAGQKLLFPKLSVIESAGADAARDDKIIGLYRDVLKQNPKSTRATVELGLFYHEIGRGSDAASVLKPLGVRSQTEKVILSTIVREYFEKQRYRELETAMTYMLEGAPESSELNYVSALALNELDDKEAAIAHFGNVQPDSRFYENAVVNTALIYQEQEKLDLAIAHLETAVGRTADNPELLLLLGTLYEEKKAYENAEEVLKRGVEIDPDNPKIFFRLGVVYDKWGRKDPCIASMKTVIRLDPTHANALNYLGYTYADLGRNLDEAERLIKRALKEKPDDGYITDSLGWVYYKKGMFKKALEIIQKAVDMVPDDPIILEHLGDAYRQLDNREKALEFYRRSLDHRKEDSATIERKIRELNGTATQAP